MEIIEEKKTDESYTGRKRIQEYWMMDPRRWRLLSSKFLSSFSCLLHEPAVFNSILDEKRCKCLKDEWIRGGKNKTDNSV